MIKIGDTVINKVQVSESGAIKEIPIVKTGQDLLHIGYNTYMTTFENPAIFEKPPQYQTAFWTLGRYIDTDTSQVTPVSVPSCRIKAWLTCSAFTPNMTKTVRIRFSPATSYKYDKDAARAYASELISELTCTMLISGGQNVVKNEYKVYMKQGSNTIDVTSYTSTAPFAGTYGGMTSLYIDNNNIPTSYNAFLKMASSVSHADTIPFGNAPVLVPNLPMTASVMLESNLPAASSIQSKVEVGSYKPEDFTAYAQNYILYLNTFYVTGASKEGPVTLSPYIGG